MADQQSLNAFGSMLGTIFGQREFNKRQEAFAEKIKGKTDPFDISLATLENDPTLYADPTYMQRHALFYENKLAREAAAAKAAQEAEALDLARQEKATGTQYRQAVGQYSPETIVEGKPLGEKGYADMMRAAALGAPDKDTATLLGTLGKDQTGFAYGTLQAEQQSGLRQAENVQQSGLRQTENIQKAELDRQADLYRHNLRVKADRIQAGQNLANQKALAEFNAKVEGGKLPSGYERTPTGQAAPMPGTADHKKVFDYLAQNKQLVDMMRDYRTMGAQGISTVGKQARDADALRKQIVNKVAQSIAGVGMATHDTDYEQAEKMVPELTTLFGTDEKAVQEIDATMGRIANGAKDVQSYAKDWRGIPAFNFNLQVEAKPRP